MDVRRLMFLQLLCFVSFFPVEPLVLHLEHYNILQDCMILQYSICNTVYVLPQNAGVLGVKVTCKGWSSQRKFPEKKI